MCSVFFLIENSQASQDTFGLMVFNRNRTFGLYCFPECEKNINLGLSCSSISARVFSWLRWSVSGVTH